jgi:hypothetical protein
VKQANYCANVTVGSGVQVIAAGTSVGDAVELVCAAGYRRLFGFQAFVCGIGGVFRLASDNSVVTSVLACEAVLDFCPPVNLTGTFARVAAFSNFRALLSEATLSCLPGYLPTAGASTLACEANHQWSAAPLVCVLNAHFCPSDAPTEFVLASANVSGTQAGSTGNFSCSSLLANNYLSGFEAIRCVPSSDNAGIWRNAHTGAPWSLPFACAYANRQGVTVRLYNNSGLLGVPTASAIAPVFAYADFQSAELRTWLFPLGGNLENCTFVVNGSEGVSGLVAVGNTPLVESGMSVSFASRRFAEVVAMLSFNAPGTNISHSYAGLLWKCADFEAYTPVDPSYLIFALTNLPSLTRNILFVTD